MHPSAEARLRCEGLANYRSENGERHGTALKYRAVVLADIQWAAEDFPGMSPSQQKLALAHFVA